MTTGRSGGGFASDWSDVGGILRGVGEIVYRWQIADDRLEWMGDPASLLGTDPQRDLSTGRLYAALLDSNNLVSPHDTILHSLGVDRGEGVAYQIEYVLRPAGPDGPQLWVEDTGRWYGSGKPSHAEGAIRIVDERHAREQRLAFLSRHDNFTGLVSRAYLLELLDETASNIRRLQSNAAFLVIGIDDLRVINEAWGQQAGDRVLTAVARRIRERLREGDTIARFSTTSIGVILLNCDEHEMPVAAERFLNAVREEVVQTEIGVLSVTTSIGGVAMPRHARSRDEAVEKARDAHLQALALGRGRFVAFAPSFEREAMRRRNLVVSQQLIAALGTDQLQLAYQPIVDIHTREPRYYEALLRLVLPDGTITAAGEFMPNVERLGLMRIFDLTVLDRVLDTLRRHPEPILTVNLSPDTASGPDWIARLQAALEIRPDIGPRLIVEITETSAIGNLDEMSRFIETLHRLGVRFATDDFGAGYTSFRNLRSLQVDIVKIDGTFIANLPDRPDDQIFARHLIELANELGIETIAEWVQDEEAAAMLRDWGVDCIQGHLSGSAMLGAPWQRQNQPA